MGDASPTAFVVVLADLQRAERHARAHLDESEWRTLEEWFSFLQVFGEARKLCCARDSRVSLSRVVPIHNSVVAHLESSVAKYESQGETPLFQKLLSGAMNCCDMLAGQCSVSNERCTIAVAMSPRLL